MQDMNEIRHHIRAVEQTRKITSAMHLVSSARMKKVMPHVEYNKRYFQRVRSAMQHILAATEGFQHPYLNDRGSERNTYIVIAGDKGLAGSYNSDVLRFAREHFTSGDNNHLIAVGITAAQYFRKQGIMPDIEIIGVSQDPSLYHARHMTQDIFRFYDEGITDRVFVVFTEFINSVNHRPVIQRLLPVEPGELVEELRAEHRTNMIYHPSPEGMFDLLVPQYTIGILFGALLHGYASEHSARMNAMQNATRNADELLKKLHMSYNMARQNAITQEITEITGTAQAQLAMEGAYGYAK